MTTIVNPLSPAAPSERPWWKRLIVWMSRHKLRTFSLLVLFFIVLELLTIPWFGVAGLKSDNPTETALMRQRIREAEKEDKPITVKQKWIPLGRIPRYVIDAIIVAEDGTFFEHNGFDWFEVQQSIEKNIEKKRAARGASTITQQVAKNLYLSTSKDPMRKLKEAIITVLLEHRLSKNRILEIYVNVIEWGRGIFGIETAAQTFFGRSASSLSVDQATRLAAVIPSPLKHRPNEDSRYVVRRKAIVYQRMAGRRPGDVPEQQENRGSEDSLPSSPATISDSLDTDEGEK